MHESVMHYGQQMLKTSAIIGQDVLEVGALDVNGSLRHHVMQQQPHRYIGVDIVPGPGVDEIVDATEIVDRFGADQFGVVLCTEMLEHAEFWKVVISNLKRVLAPGGLLLVTTRSEGFAYHHPPDHWRFTVEDFQFIFSDCWIIDLRPDPGGSGGGPGVFITVRKPAVFHEVDLDHYNVYSMAR